MFDDDMLRQCIPVSSSKLNTYDFGKTIFLMDSKSRNLTEKSDKSVHKNHAKSFNKIVIKSFLNKH